MRCSRELWQTRHLFEQRLLLLQEGRSGSSSTSTQHCSITQCLHHSWRQGGHEEAEAHWMHTGSTTPLQCHQQYDFWNTMLAFSSFALQHISSLFVLILFSPSITLSSVLIWRGIHAKGKRGLNENQHRSLYRSDISTSRRLKRHSAHYANLLSTPLRFPGVLSQLCVSSSGRKSGELLPLRSTYEKLCSK